MSVSATQNAYNLRTARNRVAVQLGVDPENLSYDERVTYNRTLAGFILQHPAGFTSAQIATAAQIAGRSYADLADTSFDWGDFGTETLANVPAVLGGFTNKLLVIGALAAVVWVFLNSSRPSGPSPVSA